MNSQTRTSGHTTGQPEYDTTLTPLMEAPPAKRGDKLRLRWATLFAFFVGGCVVAAVLFPLFVRVDTRTRGVITDEYKMPVKNATVTIRDADGNVSNTVVTNAGGEFLWKKKWLEPGTTFGKYGPYFYSHSSGGRDRVLLSPIGFHTVRVKSAVGNLPSDFALTLRFDQSSQFSGGSFYESVLNQNNEIPVGDFPAALRLFIECHGDRYCVLDLKTTCERSQNSPNCLAIVHHVIVARTGSIAGHFVSAVGMPANGAEVWLRPTNPTVSKPNAAPRQFRETRKNGTFIFPGLAPGRYTLGGLSGDGSIYERDVFITSGQATTVTLKPADFSRSPMLPPDIR